MTPLAQHERRASRRFLIRLQLIVRWADENVIGEALAESREVSSRGLFFHLPKGLKSGMPIEIVVTLPNELTHAGPICVRCLGRVMRSTWERRDKWGLPPPWTHTSFSGTARQWHKVPRGLDCRIRPSEPLATLEAAGEIRGIGSIERAGAPRSSARVSSQQGLTYLYPPQGPANRPKLEPPQSASRRRLHPVLLGHRVSQSHCRAQV